MPISHAELEESAHGGAFGNNSTPIPTDAQCKAGNYKMGRFSLHGIPIAIEQPRNTYRTGVDEKTGKRWTCRLAAHYGYISGSKGADGDGVDCFVGVCPDAEYVYAVNQHINGRFDEQKLMLGFYDQESAVNAYMGSFDRGWNGLGSIVRMTIPQLKWWLKHGDKSRPINKTDLPQEGLEAMTQRVYWNNDAMPLDGRTLDHVLYEIRRSDSGDNLLTDPVTIQEIIDDSEGVLALDALVTPYAKLERKMEILQGIMERTGKGLKPVSMQISEPFKRNGVANVAVVYELSDGQTITIYLHNPDVTPQKMAPGDEVISWKWMLNKKDITIVVAPERGQDLNVREVARRIMKLAEKNSAGFARANAKRAERMQNIQSLKDEIASLEAELKKAENERDALKIEVEDRERSLEDMHIAVREALSKMGWNGFEDGSAMTIGSFRASVSGNYAGFQVEKLDSDSGTWGEVGFMSLGSGKTALEVADGIAMIVGGDQEDGGATNSRIEDVYKALYSFSWERRDEFMSIVLTAQVSEIDIRFTTGYENGEWVTAMPDAEISRLKDEGTPMEMAKAITASANSVIDAMNNELQAKDEELDHTSPEGYAKIMADKSLQFQYQDALDSFFQARIVAVRSALRDLGWSGEQYAWPLTKDDHSLDVNLKHVGAGRNVSGVTWITAKGEISDDLTKTPEQLAADISASVPDVETNNEEPVVELSGKELGDFPDTPEGKKQLRSAASEMLDKLIGKWVPCPALGGDVEIRKSGVKKIISHSGDARKLKVVSVIDKIIGNAKKLNTREPYDGDVDKSAKLYHTLRAEILLEETPLAARVVVKEDIHGQFHYDMTIHDNDAIFDSAKDKGHDNSRPLSVTSTNGGGADPSRIARHQLDTSIDDDSALINSATLDSAGGRMVLNLFIEGEEPEVIEDDEESEEITVAKAFLQSVIDGAKDSADLMNLLDEIDASAKALIDAGMGSEYDDLIGKAAEKWAELDQQANG